MHGLLRLSRAGRWEATKSGQRFLMIKEDTSDDAAPDQLVVVLNWFSELQARVPTGG